MLSILYCMFIEKKNGWKLGVYAKYEMLLLTQMEANSNIVCIIYFIQQVL